MKPAEAPPVHVLRRWLTRVRAWVMPLVVVAAVMLPLRSAVADWCDVPTGSMEPTILVGDRILVNRLAYGLRVPFSTETWIAQWSAPARGEVVVLHSPRGGTRLVKRIIGVPGDLIEMRGNRLIVNGAEAGYAPAGRFASDDIDPDRRGRHRFLTETLGGRNHWIMLTPGAPSPATFGPVTIPIGQYLVLGDSRDLSADSRAFGLVPRDRIVGRSSRVAFSLDREHWWIPRLGRFGAPIR